MIFKRRFLHLATGFRKKMDIDVSGLRKQCKNKDEAFLEKDLVSKEPIGQFKFWYEEVCASKDILFPGAMCLATVSQDGFPSARYVICTSFSKDGFKFFTDYGSRKSTEMDHNPNVAATLYWAACDRSVRIEGQVEKLPAEESIKAFQSRPVEAQLALWGSSQSIPIESKYLLHERQSELRTQYLIPGKEIPKPDYWEQGIMAFTPHDIGGGLCLAVDVLRLIWGGYVIHPSSIEFWQAQSNRLSDRIRFRRPDDGEHPDGKLLHNGEDGWVYERLSP